MENKTCYAIVASRLRNNTYIEWLMHNLSILSESLGSFIGVMDDENLSSSLSLLEKCAGIVLVVATGGTEHVVLELREKLQDKMLLIIALPYANSLPAVMEVAPLLRRYKHTAIHYMDKFNPASYYLLRRIIKALRATTNIREARLGIVGGISPWLVYSKLSNEKAREIGIKLIEIGLDEFIKLYREAKPSEEILEKVTTGATRVSVSEASITNALRVYTALKNIIERYKLQALTIKCFDLITRLNTTACLALSLLNSSGFVAGCEGDVPATLAMMILNQVSSKPAFMANPARLSDNGVLLAHCTAPLVYGPYELMTHFESGIGVGISAKFPIGTPVTLARLDPGSLKLRVGVGVVEASGHLSNYHCRTQVLVRLENSKRLLEDSIGNHYVIAPGKYVEELRYVANLLGLGYEKL